MKIRAIAVLTAAFMFSSFSVSLSQETTSSDALSQLSTPNEFDLTKISCGDLLNLSLTDRGHLLMMYWGFAAAKRGTTKFATADIRARAQKLQDFCATSPQTPMLAAVGKFAANLSMAPASR